MIHEEYELGASDARPGTKGNALVSERAVIKGEAPEIGTSQDDDDEDWDMDVEDKAGLSSGSGSGSGVVASSSEVPPISPSK